METLLFYKYLKRIGKMAQEEGRRARKRYKNAPSYDEVKAKIDAKEKAAAERKAERKSAKKPLTPAERYEQEKAARKDKSGSFSQYRMTGSRGHGSEYQNTRSIREEVLSYLLDEGFASDEKSAEAIIDAMSEAWIESIVEGKSDRSLGLMHPFARGIKQKKGEKKEEKYRQDSEGNLTGKYSDMQRSKRQK